MPAPNTDIHNPGFARNSLSSPDVEYPFLMQTFTTLNLTNIFQLPSTPPSPKCANFTKFTYVSIRSSSSQSALTTRKYTCNHTKDVELALCSRANKEEQEALVRIAKALLTTSPKNPTPSKPTPKASSLLINSSPGNAARSSNPEKAFWLNTFSHGKTTLPHRCAGAVPKPKQCRRGVETVYQLPPFPCRDCRRKKGRWERGIWKKVEGYEYGRVMHDFEPLEAENKKEEEEKKKKKREREELAPFAVRNEGLAVLGEESWESEEYERMLDEDGAIYEAFAVEWEERKKLERL
jgi:hypothetical protein